jgi:hypothetical protein
MRNANNSNRSGPCGSWVNINGWVFAYSFGKFVWAQPRNMR